LGASSRSQAASASSKPSSAPRLDRTPRSAAEPRLLAAVDDETVRQIVGRNRDPYAIARQHPDMVAPHPPRELRSHDVATLVDLDVVLAAAESVLNNTLHLQKVAFTHT